MAHPDQLKTPVRTKVPDPDDLEDLLAEDLLWDAAEWDPDWKHAAGSEVDPVAAAQRLLRSGRLAEPLLAYRAVCLIARRRVLDREAPVPRGWPTAAWPGLTRPSDPLRPDGLAVGPATTRAWGVQEALKPQGVRLLCITGPAGIGKTRLATDIATESRLRILRERSEGGLITGDGPPAEVENAVPLLTICLRSAHMTADGQSLAMAPYDALLDLLLALGVAEHEIPLTMAGRQARYAAELRGCRPVIVVDDALDESQVLPLLPPDAGVVVVTSRYDLPGLSAYGAVYAPVPALDASGTSALVRKCFEALGTQADEAAAGAIHELCGGAPLPVILVSRWIAVATRASRDSDAALRAARGDAQRDQREFATPFPLPGLPAVAAVLGLLGEDQQAVMRMLALLQLPEADLGSICIATGLDRDRALAALAQLTEIGLLTMAESGAACAMPPTVAAYAAAWAWAAGQQAAEAYEQLIGPLIGLYERRLQGVRDAAAALSQYAREETESASAGDTAREARVGGDTAAEWAEEESLAGREVVAALLEAAAVTPHPARARRLAAVYLTSMSDLDGRESGWRETDRFIAPALAVACDAGDIRLRARALERLGRDAARQDQKTVSLGPPGSTRRGEIADPAGQTERGATAEPPDLEANPGTDSLARVAAVANEGTTAPSQPVLFGTRS